MKILIVSASFYPTLNGPVIYMDNFSKSLASRGHKVTIICSGKKETREKFGMIDLIRYKKPSSKLNPRKQYEIYRDESEKIIKKIGPEEFDYVFSGSEIFLPKLKEIFPKEKITWIVPSLRNIADNIGNKKETTLRIKNFMRVAMEGIRLIVVSNSLKKQFSKEFNRRNNIKTINPGVDLRKFESIGKKREDYVLFLGRISREKNVRALVDVFDKAHKGRLLVVGDGPEFNLLKNKIKKSERKKDIFLIGMRSNTEKFYSMSRVFVLPSKYDAFPLVLPEAMASGLPCIAFRPDDKEIITGADEIIKNNENGFLVKGEKEMAEKIDLLLSDEALWKKMSMAARKESEGYSWGKTAEKILEFSSTE